MDIGVLKSLTGRSFCDDVYRFAAETAEETVKNYCNIDEIPNGLKNTVVRIAADILRRGQYGKNGGEMPVTVSGITVGNTSTSFSAVSSLSDSDVSSIVSGYTKQLNRYRRVTFD